MLPLVLLVVSMVINGFVASPIIFVAPPQCSGPNVEYDPVHKTCKCMEGTKGDPDFFCSAEYDMFCNVKDPQMLWTFEGMRYFYDYPCLQNLAEIHTNEYEVDVFLSASYDRIGSLVLDGMGFQVDNLTVFYSDGIFSINGERSQTLNLPDEWIGNVYSVDEFTSIFSIDNLMVMFRPYSRTKRADKPYGYQIAYKKVGAVHDIYEICSHTAGEFEDALINSGYHYSELYALKLSMSAYAEMKPELQALVAHNVRDSCDDVASSYSSCKFKHKTAMLNVCGPIMTNGPIRMCLAIQGFVVLDIFAICSRAVCLDERESCAVLQAPKIKACADLTYCVHRLNDPEFLGNHTKPLGHEDDDDNHKDGGDH